MRTLQEKYNGIQEGKFSKEHFLAEARMQHPQLITRFNGYDDAVQILKNKGMIVEAHLKKESFTIVWDKSKLTKTTYQNGRHYQSKKFKTVEELVADKENTDAIQKKREERGAAKIAHTLKEARLTKNSLTDYRYKPTNEMDKYPYEQILRGIRVELEGLGVHGTPTAEEYSKALVKVSKNLAKDSIFYTNLVAGVNPKVDLHDKMVPVTAKNSVDTFNGMKKAELKEGFKKLIKKVLSENMGDMFGDEEREERRINYRQPGDNDYDVEDYRNEDEFELHGEEANDQEEEIDYDDENFSDPFIDGDLDESKSGELYTLAQESNSLKDFLIAVKNEYPEIDLRQAIEGLKQLWDNRGEEDQEGDPGYRGYESPSDRAMRSDAWVQAQKDMMESKKSLSELLK